MTFFSTGLFRGLFAQVVGTLFGMGLTAGIRALMGLKVWEPEPIAGGGCGDRFDLFPVWCWRTG